MNLPHKLPRWAKYSILTVLASVVTGVVALDYWIGPFDNGAKIALHAHTIKMGSVS